MLLATAIAVVNSQLPVSTYAGLFKIDFGVLQNDKEIVTVESDGTLTPTGTFHDVLTNWTLIPTWTFADPNLNVLAERGHAVGTSNAALTEVTWKLADFSADKDSDVTMTILDNVALTLSLGGEPPIGQTHNDPAPQNVVALYDTVVVPAIVKDDYSYRNPDTAGTELLMRFANLNPGFYNVTVFEGRVNDANGRYGKVWVDDITGAKEPATQNTGNYSGTTAEGTPAIYGSPKTVSVEVKAGQYLWFAEMEDNSGGISGLIIRSVSTPPPPVDITTSKGLFKLDFGHLQNDKEILDADGNGTGTYPPKLGDWVVIPTWSYADPNANVRPDSDSGTGVANADGTEVTWKLIDASKDTNKNVTVTILDNVALTASLSLDPPTGQTANNPAPALVDVVYDGVVVPAVVKDDYLYRLPDTAGTEVLMRFAGLKPGPYNVTVFEGRVNDGNGRFGKVWVDDIKGLKEPAEQNTGNYAGTTIVDGTGIPTPVGNPQTIAVTLKAGEYLWFAEMEDNSGGISGMIVRGTGATTTVPPGPLTIVKTATGVTITYTAVLQSADKVEGPYVDVPGATSPYATATTGTTAKFYRARQ